VSIFGLMNSRRQFLGAISTGMIGACCGDVLGAELPKEIRVGILSLEGHYGEVTNAAKVLPNIRVTAVSDARERVLQGARFGEAKKYEDYRKLLAEEKLDLVCVCGENGTRAKILVECAEKKIPILSEKPLALSFSELKEVKRAVEKNRVPLSMLLQMRGMPAYLGMREIVQSGEIGEVVLMDAQKSYKLGERPDWMKSRRSYGGTIPYIGVHMIDLMLWVSGREFTEASAFHSTIGAPDLGEMENNSSMIFKMDNKGSASLRMDYLRPATAATHGDDRLRVVGSKGIVEYQNGALTLVTGAGPLRKIEKLPEARNLCVDLAESIYLNKPRFLKEEEIFRVSEIILKVRDAADRREIVKL
jgi:predicted dehydrogenase